MYQVLRWLGDVGESRSSAGEKYRYSGTGAALRGGSLRRVFNKAIRKSSMSCDAAGLLVGLCSMVMGSRQRT